MLVLMAYLLKFGERNSRREEFKKISLMKCYLIKWMLIMKVYKFILLLKFLLYSGKNVLKYTHTHMCKHTHSTYLSFCILMSMLCRYTHMCMWMSLYMSKRMESPLVYTLMRVKWFGKLLDLFRRKLLCAGKVYLNGEIIIQHPWCSSI